MNQSQRSGIDGFWILTIVADAVTSGGVAVFVAGKVFGGDSGFSWMGSYSASGDCVKGRLKVSKFDNSMISIFQIVGDYELHFSGTLEDEATITGTAMVSNQPQHNLAVRLTKRASL